MLNQLSAQISSQLQKKLLATLKEISSVRRLVVAYSGGLDSHVLLHALARIKQGVCDELLAVHVNHGLSSLAADWAAHCQHVCADLDIPFQTFNVDATPKSGESPEEAARNARYGVLSALIQPGDCLLTAHHQDDQAETLILQLLRGGGPHGLAAMPCKTVFSKGLLARPLLNFTRQDLQAYAAQQGLKWVDDPSNFDTGFERNFLRHQLMPVLKERWPSIARTLTRSAAHQAEAADLLDMIAAMDLQQVIGPMPDMLCVSSLMELDQKRQRNVIRFWLKKIGLPLPASNHLEHIYRDVLMAAEDSTPLVHWSGAEIRRYRDMLYAMPPLTAHNVDRVHGWPVKQCSTLDLGDQYLQAVPVTGAGVKAACLYDHTVTIRYRQGGERFHPAGHAHTRTLKNLLQEQAIPPWQRDRIPLVYVDGQLAVVAGFWVSEPVSARASEPGLLITRTRV